MIIKNIYIPDLRVIEEVLKYLSINNIEYLFIKDSYELHFNNYILRFFIGNDIFEIINEYNKQNQEFAQTLIKEDYKRIETTKRDFNNSNIVRTIKNSELILRRNLGYRRNSGRNK